MTSMIFKDIQILDENFRLRKDIHVLVQGRFIEKISSEPLVCEGATVYDGRNKLLMPAFYNAHCHAPMTIMRGYGEGLPLQRWLEEKVFPFEALLDDEDVYWASLLGIAEMLRSGAVAFSDMYMRMNGIARAVLESGIKANLSHGCAAPDGNPEFKDTSAWEGTKILLEHRRRQQGDRLIADLALHAEYSSNERSAESLFAFAAENGLRQQIHLSETKMEHERCKSRRGMTPLQYFVSLGVANAPVVFAHAVWLEEDDYDLLRSLIKQGADISLVHNPSSNLKLASGFANLKEWQKTSVNIAIGTDGACSNNNLNMLEEVALAALLQKGVSGDASFLQPDECFRIACRGGALAQGREDCGLLKEGYRADLIVFNLDAPHLQPIYDLPANILHAAQQGDLSLSMADGTVLYRDGAYPTLDIERVLYEIRRISNEKTRILES